MSPTIEADGDRDTGGVGHPIRELAIAIKERLSQLIDRSVGQRDPGSDDSGTPAIGHAKATSRNEENRRQPEVGPRMKAFVAENIEWTGDVDFRFVSADEHRQPIHDHHSDPKTGSPPPRADARLCRSFERLRLEGFVQSGGRHRRGIGWSLRTDNSTLGR